MRGRQALSFVILTFVANWVWATSQEFLPKGHCPQKLEYSYYTVCYSPNHRQPLWTKHELTVEMVEGRHPRNDSFKEDQRLRDPVYANDYRGSGFDRGHMVPAGDMKLNSMSMSESFYMTNMTPQNPNLNRFLWVGIENRIRAQVKNYGDAHVVTAPVFEERFEKTAKGISIPAYFYKIAYFPRAGFMEAYFVENRSHSPTPPIRTVLITVREIEEITHLDFFSELPQDVQDHLEQSIHLAAEQ